MKLWDGEKKERKWGSRKGMKGERKWESRSLHDLLQLVHCLRIRHHGLHLRKYLAWSAAKIFDTRLRNYFSSAAISRYLILSKQFVPLPSNWLRILLTALKKVQQQPWKRKARKDRQWNLSIWSKSRKILQYHLSEDWLAKCPFVQVRHLSELCCFLQQIFDLWISTIRFVVLCQNS